MEAKSKATLWVDNRWLILFTLATCSRAREKDRKGMYVDELLGVVLEQQVAVVSCKKLCRSKPWILHCWTWSPDHVCGKWYTSNRGL
jgi:hypothetical protein